MPSSGRIKNTGKSSEPVNERSAISSSKIFSSRSAGDVFVSIPDLYGATYRYIYCARRCEEMLSDFLPRTPITLQSIPARYLLQYLHLSDNKWYKDHNGL